MVYTYSDDQIFKEDVVGQIFTTKVGDKEYTVTIDDEQVSYKQSDDEKSYQLEAVAAKAVLERFNSMKSNSPTFDDAALVADDMRPHLAGVIEKDLKIKEANVLGFEGRTDSEDTIDISEENEMSDDKNDAIDENGDVLNPMHAGKNFATEDTAPGLRDSPLSPEFEDEIAAIGSFSVPDLGVVKNLKGLNEKRRRYFSPTLDEKFEDMRATNQAKDDKAAKAADAVENKAKAKLAHGINTRMLTTDMIVMTPIEGSDKINVYVPGLESEDIELATDLTEEQLLTKISEHFQAKYGSADNPNTIPPMSFGSADDVTSILTALTQLNDRIVGVNKEAMLHDGGRIKKYTGSSYLAESADFLSKLSPRTWKKHQKAMDEIMSPKMREELLNSVSQIPARDGDGEMRDIAMKDAPKELKKDIDWLKAEIDKLNELSPLGPTEGSAEAKEIEAYKAQLLILEPLHEALDKTVKALKDPRSSTAKRLDNISAGLTSLATAAAAGLAAWGISQPAFQAGVASYFTGTAGSATLQGGFGIAWGNIAGFFSGAAGNVAAGSMIAAGPIPIIGWVAAGIGATILAVKAYQYINKHYGEAIGKWWKELPVADKAREAGHEVMNYIRATPAALSKFGSAVGGVVRGQMQAIDRMQSKGQVLGDFLVSYRTEEEEDNLTPQEALELAAKLEEALILSEVYECTDSRANEINPEHLKTIIALKVQGLEGNNTATAFGKKFNDKLKAYAGPKGHELYEQTEIIPKVKARIAEMIGREPTFQRVAEPDNRESIAHLDKVDKQALRNSGEINSNKLKADLYNAQAEVVSAVKQQFRKGKKHHMSTVTYEHAVAIVQQADEVLDKVQGNIKKQRQDAKAAVKAEAQAVKAAAKAVAERPQVVAKLLKEKTARMADLLKNQTGEHNDDVLMLQADIDKLTKEQEAIKQAQADAPSMSASASAAASSFYQSFKSIFESDRTKTKAEFARVNEELEDSYGNDEVDAAARRHLNMQRRTLICKLETLGESELAYDAVNMEIDDELVLYTKNDVIQKVVNDIDELEDYILGNDETPELMEERGRLYIELKALEDNLDIIIKQQAAEAAKPKEEEKQNLVQWIKAGGLSEWASSLFKKSEHAYVTLDSTDSSIHDHSGDGPRLRFADTEDESPLLSDEDRDKAAEIHPTAKEESVLDRVSHAASSAADRVAKFVGYKKAATDVRELDPAHEVSLEDKITAQEKLVETAHQVSREQPQNEELRDDYKAELETLKGLKQEASKGNSLDL
jgi:hypothetical protein